jgi:ADP-ribosylglycohydrolase
MSSPTDPRVSRIIGALLGVHSGDSLGATLEFKPWSWVIRQYPTGLREIVGGGSFNWPAGHATDDTDLTRAVLLAYRDYAQSRASDFEVAKAAAEYSLKWRDGDWPGRKKGSWPVDIGNATEIGLHRYKMSRDPEKSGAGIDSAGNGSLMRCIPTALFVDSREKRVKESMAISAFTHNDLRCTVACAVYNEIVAALVEGKTPLEAVEVGKTVANEFNCAEVTNAIKEGETLPLAKIAAEGPTSVEGFGAAGYVIDSLKISIAAVLDPRSLEDVLADVVRIGQDSDTNGAIAGGLLGARDGIEKIPRRWLEKLQFRKEFEDVAMGILRLQQGKK